MCVFTLVSTVQTELESRAHSISHSSWNSHSILNSHFISNLHFQFVCYVAVSTVLTELESLVRLQSLAGSSPSHMPATVSTLNKRTVSQRSTSIMTRSHDNTSVLDYKNEAKNDIQTDDNPDSDSEEDAEVAFNMSAKLARTTAANTSNNTTFTPRRGHDTTFTPRRGLAPPSVTPRLLRTSTRMKFVSTAVGKKNVNRDTEMAERCVFSEVFL